uniref:Uncharacterized protein n=1 Tax=Arundo donax TaxID=35708 RepID=A0A0A9EHT5_ARUDO
MTQWDHMLLVLQQTNCFVTQKRQNNIIPETLKHDQSILLGKQLDIASFKIE